jgi:hypothetical protein
MENLMILQETPADTFNFMLYGFGVILGLMAVFVVSMRIRYRGLARDFDMLRSIEDERET